jgi:hypothetical protein
MITLVVTSSLRTRIRKSFRYLRDHKYKRKLMWLGVAVLLTPPTIWVLQFVFGLQVETPRVTYNYTVLNETVYAAPINVETNGPAPFESAGRIYAYQTSPYADAFTTYDYWLSTDNSSWVKVPLLSSKTDNRSEMANLGLIPLDTPTIKLYVKYYIPPQEFTHPVNATKAEIEQSFVGYMQIVRQPTQTDTFELIFVSYPLISGVLELLDFFLMKEDRKPTKRRKAGRR